jgi:hypothetical protein
VQGLQAKGLPWGTTCNSSSIGYKQSFYC